MARRMVAAGSDAERDMAYGLIPARHRATVADILAIPGVGFTNIKLENTLTAATAFSCNLESFGALRGRRQAAVEQIGAFTGYSGATSKIIQGARAVGHALGMLRLPASGMGLDLTGDAIAAFKAYCRTDRMDERLTEGAFGYDLPTPDREMAAAVALADAVCPSAKSEIAIVLGWMQAAGGTLDALGVDIDPHGATELKLYMVPRVPAGRNQRTFSREESELTLSAALELCGLIDQRTAALELVSTINGLDLPCSHITIDIRPAGERAVKVYFDTWNMGREQIRFADPEATRQAIAGAYAAAGVTLDGVAMNTLVGQISEGGLIIDSIAVDFEMSGHGAKTYLRSSADIGEGVALGHLPELSL